MKTTNITDVPAMVAGRLPRTINNTQAVTTSPISRSVLVMSAVMLVIVTLPFAATYAGRARKPSRGPSSVADPAAKLRGSAVARKSVSVTAKSGKASVTTDKSDYAPGETVLITGKGWRPGELIRLKIHRSNAAADEVLTAKADASGSFRNASLTIRKSDLGVSFVLTAVGLSSKYTAEITFTDANITVSTRNGGSAAGANGFHTFTLTKQVFTGSADCSAGGGTATTVSGVGNPAPHVFSVNVGDSVTLTAPHVSNQNGLFRAWVSPDGGSFTQVPNTNGEVICVPGDAVAHTYLVEYGPGLIVLDDTCVTPKTLFNLGETVCVRVFAEPTGLGALRVQFVDPDFVVRNDPNMFPITSDQQTLTFTLPATNTTGATDNRGTWSGRIIDVSAAALSNPAFFLVHNPNAGQEAADLRVQKGGPSFPVPPNGTIQYEIRLANAGPDTAQSVSLSDNVPANTTFMSYKQLSGPSFTSTTPSVGGTGNISSTGTLPVATPNNPLNDPVNTAVFRLIVKVNNGVADGTDISNTASATTSTFETHPANDMSTASNTVLANGCSLLCPPDVTAAADTTCSGVPGAVVMFANPTPTGTCGSIACVPPSGSCFPVGTTTVNCNDGNTTCSFQVTVASCILTCPPNQTASTGPGAMQCCATVNYPAPTTSGGCGTVTCNPPAGSCFPVGTTTVTCSESGGVSCQFTVTVADNTPPVVTCPTDVSAATPISACSVATGCAVVNFTATATDNCPGVNLVCNPPSGFCFPVGSSSVTCTATDASGNTASCSFLVNVFDVCLQDDSNPSTVLLINSKTGAYKFCCRGMSLTGTGTISVKGCLVSLQHSMGDRRVSASIDRSQFKGSASLQSPPGIVKCTIVDRDMRNNSCACP